MHTALDVFLYIYWIKLDFQEYSSFSLLWTFVDNLATLQIIFGTNCGLKVFTVYNVYFFGLHHRRKIVCLAECLALRDFFLNFDILNEFGFEVFERHLNVYYILWSNIIPFQECHWCRIIFYQMLQSSEHCSITSIVFTKHNQQNHRNCSNSC